MAHYCSIDHLIGSKIVGIFLMLAVLVKLFLILLRDAVI